MSEDERVNWTPIVVGDNYEDGKGIGPSFINADVQTKWDVTEGSNFQGGARA